MCSRPRKILIYCVYPPSPSSTPRTPSLSHNHQKFASRIKTGNLEDDIAKVKNVDWIIEVVVERLDIKKIVFDRGIATSFIIVATITLGVLIGLGRLLTRRLTAKTS